MTSKRGLTPAERLRRRLAGDDVDRLPFAFWTHFPNRDRHPRVLARLTLEHQRKFAYDFIKFTPYGQYSVVDWGADVAVREGFDTLPEVARPFITDPRGWSTLSRLSGTEGEYAVILESQRLLMKDKPPGLPFLQTIFSPLTTAMKLSSEGLIIDHLRSNPIEVHAGLSIITQTTLEFMVASFDGGADGIFIASQLSAQGKLTDAEHAEFVEAYDRILLDEASRRGWFNVVHIHGDGSRLDVFSSLPVEGISWHDVDDGPRLDENPHLGGKLAVGGLSWWPEWNAKSVVEIEADLNRAMAAVPATGLIVAPGCIFGPNTADEGLLRVRDLLTGG